MPKPKVFCHVGRNAGGEIVLDVTRTEMPAMSLRMVFDSPESAARIADLLAEHANDHDANAFPYPEQAGSMIGGER